MAGTVALTDQNNNFVPQGPADGMALLARTAASAGGSGADPSNIGCCGLHLVIDITAIGGTGPSVTATVAAVLMR